MVSGVVFDFDGTLADTFDVFLDIAKYIVGRDYIAPERIEAYRSMTLTEILDDLHISKLKVALYYFQGKHIFAERLPDVELFAGIKDVLDDLHDEYHIGVLTNNDADLVEDFLNDRNVRTSFVRGNNPIHTKEASIREITEEYFDFPGDMVYVGDQAGDIKAAHNAGCKAIGVTWGFHTASFLEKTEPDILVHKVSELVEAIQSL